MNKRSVKSFMIRGLAFFVALMVFVIIWKIFDAIITATTTNNNSLSEVANRNLDAAITITGLVVSVFLGKKTYDKISSKSN